MGQYFLANVQWSGDYRNVMDFENANAQFNYISSKRITPTINHTNIIEKNGELNVNFKIGEVEKGNYIAYNNSGTWKYAHINIINVESEKVTRVKLIDDVWQNSHLQMKIHKCFVEREHRQRHSLQANGMLKPTPFPVSDIGVGKLYPTYRDIYDTGWKYVVIAYVNPKVVDTGSGPNAPITHGSFLPHENIYSFIEKVNYITIPIKDDFGANHPMACSLNDLIASDIWDNPEVVSMFITPYPIFDIDDDRTYTSVDFYTYRQGSNDITLKGLARTAQIVNHTTTHRIPLLDAWGYIKKSDVVNQENTNPYFETKLLSSPYWQLILKFENTEMSLGYEELNISYDNGQAFIELYTEVAYTVDGAVITYTVDTLREVTQDRYSQTVVLNNIMTLTSEAFTNYIFNSRQSYKVGIRNQLVETTANTGLAALSGGLTAPYLIGTAISSASSIANTMNSRMDMKLQPTQVRGSNDQVTAFSVLSKPYIVAYFAIPAFSETMSIYDYYNKYGYKVSRQKVPYTRTRSVFNYVKTEDSIISNCGENEDNTSMQNIFNSGVTIWHTYQNPDGSFKEPTIGDTSKENKEMTHTIPNENLNPGTIEDDANFFPANPDGTTTLPNGIGGEPGKAEPGNSTITSPIKQDESEENDPNDPTKLLIRVSPFIGSGWRTNRYKKSPNAYTRCNSSWNGWYSGQYAQFMNLPKNGVITYKDIYATKTDSLYNYGIERVYTIDYGSGLRLSFLMTPENIPCKIYKYINGVYIELRQGESISASQYLYINGVNGINLQYNGYILALHDYFKTGIVYPNVNPAPTIPVHIEEPPLAINILRDLKLKYEYDNSSIYNNMVMQLSDNTDVVIYIAELNAKYSPEYVKDFSCGKVQKIGGEYFIMGGMTQGAGPTITISLYNDSLRQFTKRLQIGLYEEDGSKLIYGKSKIIKMDDSMIPYLVPTRTPNEYNIEMSYNVPKPPVIFLGKIYNPNNTGYRITTYESGGKMDLITTNLYNGEYDRTVVNENSSVNDSVTMGLPYKDSTSFDRFLKSYDGEEVKVLLHGGAEVFSPYGGVVEDTGYSLKYGRFVKIKFIDTFSDYTAIIGGLERASVKRGAVVSKLTPIGTVSTMLQGPILIHSLQRYGGVFVDPYTIYKAW